MNLTPAELHHSTTRLVVTEANGHPPECGTRVMCPEYGHHDLGSYHPAERQWRRLDVLIVCHVCQRTWREVAP